MPVLNTRSRQHDPPSTELRSCIELVRTCHHDLLHLIQLRNQHAGLLPPEAVERIDGIIEAAKQCHDRVNRLVEKCRPEAHGGKTPFRSKMKWILADSRDFEIQKPLLHCHHAAVLAELNFVRQVALTTPTVSVKAEEKEEAGEEPAQISSTTFSNLSLLGDLFEHMPLATHEPAFSSRRSSPSINPTPSLRTSDGHLEASTLASMSTSASANPSVDQKATSLVEVNEKFLVSPHIDNPKDPSPYSDEKEVVLYQPQQSSERDCVILNRQENTGLRLLLDLNDPVSPPLAEAPSTPLAEAPSPPMSQVSSMSTLPNLYAISVSNTSQTN